MSRSNPTSNSPHPCARWIEWNGEVGEFRYYDKDAKKNVSLGDKITFILLDQLATIKGWHDASNSGIYSNEVRDSRQDVLVVKAFKGGTLAEGIYKQIRDKLLSQGADFTANLYVAVKIGTELTIASIQFKGAALFAWSEFSKANRTDLFKKAIRCNGFNEGKKGRITYRTPIFSLSDVSPETDAKALDLDRILQEFLKGYFSRTSIERAESPAAHAHATREPGDDGEDGWEQQVPPPKLPGGFEQMEDDIVF